MQETRVCILGQELVSKIYELSSIVKKKKNLTKTEQKKMNNTLNKMINKQEVKA